MHNDSSKPPQHPSSPIEQAGDQAGAKALGNDAHDQRHISRALVHDLRNAAAPIRNAVYLLRLRCREDPTLTPITDIIDRQANEIVRLLSSPDEAARADRVDAKSTSVVPAALGKNDNSKMENSS